MTIPANERALLPSIALQGAISTLGGFIGFFIMRAQNVDAMLRFTAGMMTAALAATLLAYALGPRLRLTGKRLFTLGFIAPGLLILLSDRSADMMAVAYGTFIGLTWSARHWLEMSLFSDAQRDSYAAHSGALTVVFGIGATLAATLVLTGAADHSGHVYDLYGALSVIGGLLVCRWIPATEPVSIDRPVAVMRQPQFIACLPLFFLESGLFGVGQALSSAGAVKALGSASQFGWVATAASLVGGIALYFTRKNRDVGNRAQWLGASCLVVGSAFLLLGASAWMPVLFIAYSVLKAAGSPFLMASEQVLNQRTLDIAGKLSDRIVARECVLWLLRMTSLLLFWGLAGMLSSTQLLVAGSLMLAAATGMEYVIGQNWFWKAGGKAQTMPG